MVQGVTGGRVRWSETGGHRRFDVDGKSYASYSVTATMAWQSVAITKWRRYAERWLVEQQKARPRQKRPGDRQHLLLAAGKGARGLAAALAEYRKQRDHAGMVRSYAGGIAAGR